LVVSFDEGTADEKSSFHSGTCCVRVFDDVVVPNDDNQTDASSFDICRCANGFCICVVNETFELGHDESYFVDHSVGANGVQGTLGVGISLINVVEFDTFGVDGIVVILF
jgi:hypothetical protein